MRRTLCVEQSVSFRNCFLGLLQRVKFTFFAKEQTLFVIYGFTFSLQSENINSLHNYEVLCVHFLNFC